MEREYSTGEVCEILGWPYMRVYRYAGRLFPEKAHGQGWRWSFTGAEVEQLLDLRDRLHAIQAEAAELGLRQVVVA